MAFFQRDGLRFASDLHFCFVCGAADPLEGEAPKFRRLFLDWAAKRQTKLVCVRAESTVTDLLRQIDERRKARSLSILEDIIAKSVDSLLIFPESAGSLAELGLFSASKDICKKMLVVMEPKYQEPSFIKLGPVQHIAQKSAFPSPIILAPNYEDTFAQIEDHLLGDKGARRPYRHLYTSKPWVQYKNKEKIAILDSIFDLMGFCTEEDLQFLIFRCFGKYDVSELRLLTALLSALGRVERTDEADIVRINSWTPERLMEGQDDEAVELKAKWSESYRQYLPEASRAMDERNP